MLLWLVAAGPDVGLVGLLRHLFLFEPSLHVHRAGSLGQECFAQSQTRDMARVLGWEATPQEGQSLF